jgi:hypothetical protein
MKMGRVVLGISCATLVLWRILVVGVNDLTAIRAARWIESSIWLSEDPLAPLELRLATLLVPSRFSDRSLMYVAEILGMAAWSVVALCCYSVFRRLRFVTAWDTVTVRPVTVVVLAVIAALFGLVGGWYRLPIARALDLRSLSMMQALGILTFVFAAVLPLAGFVSWNRRRVS